MPHDAAEDRKRSRTERFQLVMGLFEELVALAADERAARLAALAPEDAELRREVEAMLAADARTTTPMTVGGGLGAFADVAARIDGDEEGALPLPVLSGQYRIVRRIGEGGMGVVYEAEQALPRRAVALKAIRAGFASRQVLRRFEQEAHILGRLHHPGIAQVYEAGLSEPERGDQAFIAMEYVDGLPLAEWAKGRSIREKVELVARVCEAVQHAHQRRVIHRDLKPANLLVDRTGQPKVLDFGVARLAEEGADGALETRAGQLLGTLPYMSPEQAAGDPGEVDARTDVYALGVILYELLSGRLPNPPAGRALAEMALAIRDEEPPRLGRLDRALRGDLESIASMALRKDRERRYQSALELGDDLRRWLDGRPVRARGESTLYVLRRQVRRHRWLALSSALAIVALVAFAITTKLAQRRAASDARELARVLRSSRIELGRMMALTGNLSGAEQLVWDAHFQGPDEHSRWALWDLYSRFPCLRAFAAHDDSVLCLALSPSGDRLATGSHDKTVRVWDWRKGESLAVHDFGEFTIGLAFTHGGSKLVAADWNGELAGWDAQSGEELWHARDTGLPRIVSFAAAEERALGACATEGELCALVDLDDGRVLRRWEETGAVTTSVALDREGRRVAVGRADGSIVLYDTATGAELQRLEGQAEAVTCMRFASDDALASGARDGAVLIYALADGSVSERFQGEIGSARSISFTRDGTRVMLACASGVEIRDRSSGTWLDDLPQLRETAFAATFAPGDDAILAGSVGGAVRLWELAPSERLRTLPLRVERGVAMAMGTGGSLVARDAGGGEVEVLDLEGRVTARWPTGDSNLEQFAFDPTGERLALHSEVGRVSVWSVADGALRFRRDLDQGLQTLRFAPDGRTLAVELQPGSLRLLDADTGEDRRVLEQPDGLAQRIAYSADGKRIATSHAKGRIELWSADDGRLELTIASPHAIYSLGFDPRGDLLYAGTWDGRLETFALPGGALVRSLEAHAQTVQGVVPTRDGRIVVTTGGDGLFRLWSRDVDVCLLALDAKAGLVATYGFDPSDRYLRAIYWDGSVREWDLAAFDPHVAGNEAYQLTLRAKASDGAVRSAGQ